MAMCSGRGQDAASRHAVRRIHSPSAMMMPLSSASGMKVDGRHQAVTRMMPAHQRLESGDLAVDMRLRLVVQRELVRAQSPCANPAAARASRAAACPSTLRRSGWSRALPILRGTSAASALATSVMASCAVLADKCATPMVSPTRSGVAVDIDVGIERRDEPFGQRLGGRRLRPGRRDDGEFVAADAGEERALASRLPAAAPLRAVARRRPHGRTHR